MYASEVEAGAAKEAALDGVMRYSSSSCSPFTFGA